MRLQLLKQATQPVDQSYRIIPLTKGQFAICDPDDFESLSRYNWHACQSHGKTYYAQRNIRQPDGTVRIVKMHRVIMEPPAGIDIDHRDGNSLNNRRANLRLATHAQNQHNRKAYATNTSGYKGVSYYRPTGKWVARIELKGKCKGLGYFFTPEAAHAAYIAAAKELHGEFARWE